MFKMIVVLEGEPLPNLKFFAASNRFYCRITLLLAPLHFLRPAFLILQRKRIPQQCFTVGDFVQGAVNSSSTGTFGSTLFKMCWIRYE